MRWPRKREFLSYYMLSKKLGGCFVSFHDLVFLVSRQLNCSVKTAKSIVKRLVSLGFIKRENSLFYIRPLDDVLGEYYVRFVSRRLRLRS